MSAGVWIAAAVFAFLVLLFGITNTWGIIFFLILLVLLGVGIWQVIKDRGKKMADSGNVPAKPMVTSPY